MPDRRQRAGQHAAADSAGQGYAYFYATASCYAMPRHVDARPLPLLPSLAIIFASQCVSFAAFYATLLIAAVFAYDTT